MAFEGGGPAALGHQGALEIFHERNLIPQIKYFSGSSSGSFPAAGLACGATVPQLKQLIMSVDLTKFLDDSPGFFKDIYRLFTKYGWYKGDFLEEWYGCVLKEICGKADITFQEAYQKTGNHLTITTVNMTTGQVVYMNHQNTPHLPVKIAVRRSTAIPLFYKPNLEKHSRSQKQPDDYFVDGGLLDNYPIRCFDQILDHSEVVGFKLMSYSEIKDLNNPYIDLEQPSSPNNLGDYVRRFLTMLINRNYKLHVDKVDWQRTVKIDVGSVSSLAFDLSEESKETLLVSGRQAAEKFLAEFSLEEKAH
jgi:NTE family protein